MAARATRTSTATAVTPVQAVFACHAARQAHQPVEEGPPRRKREQALKADQPPARQDLPPAADVLTDLGVGPADVARSAPRAEKARAKKGGGA